jgi:chromosome segregation ATPase
MTAPTAVTPRAATWRLKAPDGSVFGPCSVATLHDWAAQGRIEPGSSVSPNGAVWRPAESLEPLHLEWIIEGADGSRTGPFHAEAVRAFAAEGAIGPETPLAHLRTGRRSTVGELLAAASAAATPAVEEERGALASEIARLRARVEAERNTRSAAEADLATRTEQFRAAQFGMERELRSAREVLGRQKLAFEEQLAKMEATGREQVAGLESRVADLARRCAESEEAHRNTVESLRRAEAERDEAGKRASTLETTAADLRRVLDAVEAERNGMEVLLRTARADETAAREALANTEAARGQVEALLRREQAESTAYRVTAGQREQALSERVRTLASRAESAVAEAQAVRSALEEAREDARKKLQQTAKALEDATANATARIGALDARIAAAESERDQAVRCWDESERDRERLRGEVADLERRDALRSQDSERMNRRIEDAISERDAAQEAHRDALTRCTCLESALAHSRDREANAQAALDRLAGQVDSERRAALALHSEPEPPSRESPTPSPDEETPAAESATPMDGDVVARMQVQLEHREAEVADLDRLLNEYRGQIRSLAERCAALESAGAPTPPAEPSASSMRKERADRQRRQRPQPMPAAQWASPQTGSGGKDAPPRTLADLESRAKEEILGWQKTREPPRP